MISMLLFNSLLNNVSLCFHDNLKLEAVLKHREVECHIKKKSEHEAIVFSCMSKPVLGHEFYLSLLVCFSLFNFFFPFFGVLLFYLFQGRVGVLSLIANYG